MACGLVRGEVELGGGDVGVALGVGAAIRREAVNDALQQLPRLGRRALKLLDSWWAEAGQQSEGVPTPTAAPTLTLTATSRRLKSLKYKLKFA